MPSPLKPAAIHCPAAPPSASPVGRQSTSGIESLEKPMIPVHALTRAPPPPYRGSETVGTLPRRCMSGKASSRPSSHTPSWSSPRPLLRNRPPPIMKSPGVPSGRSGSCAA